MGHSNKDWGLSTASNIAYPMSDLGELSVRLGSIVSHDRRGDVIWADGFENGISGWSTLGFGAGWEGQLCSAYSRLGGSSCRLKTGSNAGDFMAISRYWPKVRNNRLGMEFSVAFTSTMSHVGCHVQVYDGTSYFVFGIRYDIATDEVQIYSIPGYHVVFATGFTRYKTPHLFHTFKVVADLDKSEYVRAIIDEQEWDLSAYPLIVGAAAVGPSTHWIVDCDSDPAVLVNCYIDDVIATQNEP